MRAGDPAGIELAALLPIVGESVDIRADQYGGGPWFYAVLEEAVPAFGGGLDEPTWVTDVIFRPYDQGAMPEFGMRAFPVELGYVLDEGLREAAVVDLNQVLMVAVAEIDDAEDAPGEDLWDEPWEGPPAATTFDGETVAADVPVTVMPEPEPVPEPAPKPVPEPVPEPEPEPDPEPEPEPEPEPDPEPVPEPEPEPERPSDLPPALPTMLQSAPTWDPQGDIEDPVMFEPELSDEIPPLPPPPAPAPPPPEPRPAPPALAAPPPPASEALAVVDPPRRAHSRPTAGDPPPRRTRTISSSDTGTVTDRRPLVIAAVAASLLALGGAVMWGLSQRTSTESVTAPSTTPRTDTTTSTTSPPPPPPPSPESIATIRTLLPVGYPPQACRPVSAADPGGLVTMACGPNTDPGGPPTAQYTLFTNRTALIAAFNGLVETSSQLICPGNIQSPGPWRRNANPDRPSGILFCGNSDDREVVIWTDEERLLLSAVKTGERGPNLDQLYQWWSSHS